MKPTLTALAVAACVFFALPALASTTRPPNLAIAKDGKTIKTVPIFDKWTDGATLAVGDLGTDGVAEIAVGAGPGSLPEISVFRQDGSLIRKFNAFDENIADGVIVNIGDVNKDGINEIIAATGPDFGKYIRVFDGYGKLLNDWYPRPDDVRVMRTQETLQATGISYSVPAPAFTNGRPEVAKEIDVSLSQQRLYAYENGRLVATYLVSTGTNTHPTIPGEYKVLRKVAIKEYIGPGYDLPNTHWNTQFSTRGDYMHEAWWHNNFGNQMSHGCVNMRKDDAKFIYDWSEIGTPVNIEA